MDKVYTIIVNYKTEDFIKRAIESINEESINNYILIVDNEFTDSSLSFLNKLKSNNLDVITSNKNLGFAGGINYGYDYLKSKFNDVDYIFLLNPDAMATKNVIVNLLETLNSNKTYAAISPRIFDNKSKEDWFTGTMIDFENCKIINNPKLDKNMNSIIDVFNGCAVLFDAKKFEAAGKFDEETFLYYDEANLSMNLLRYGYKCVYVPSLEVYHDVSSSTGKYSFLKSYYMMRNHIYFFRKFKTNYGLCVYKVPIRNLLSALKHFRFKSVRGIIKAIIDSFKNKKGKQI